MDSPLIVDAGRWFQSFLLYLGLDHDYVCDLVANLSICKVSLEGNQSRGFLVVHRCILHTFHCDYSDSKSFSFLSRVLEKVEEEEITSRSPISMVQKGMHLMGTVKNVEFIGRAYYYTEYHDTSSPISLCVQFDRGCITSTMCPCRRSSIWCKHVIMLCIARIRGLVPCEIHPPMSEILSQFNRDQLQKLIQHFLEKVPLVGIPPMLEIACQLKDKESEVNKQCGAPDLTAGGLVSKVARWEIDEELIIARLGEEWQSLYNPSNACIYDFKDFTTFLLNHDGNVVTVFEGFLETIKDLHQHLSRFGHTEDPHESHYHSPFNQLYPIENRYPFYLVLIQGLQIFFVDPLISKGCKEEIADLLKSEDAFTLSEPLTEHYTSLLQETVLVSEESPQPTLHYLKKLQSALQGDGHRADHGCGEGSKDSRILLSSLVAVFCYWLFHKHPCNSASSAVVLDICKSIFPALPLATSTFEDLVAVNKCLEGIQLSSFLRHGQVLMEYLIHSRVDQQEMVNLATKLLGASSVGMSVIVQTSSKDTFFLVTQAEEAILCMAQKHISCERELFTPVLHQIVEDYLHRDVGEGVFVWPWSLLRLAALDLVMVEEVREVTQNFIGNANSILHCTSQTDQVYPSHVVDHVRDSLLSLLQHLLNTLRPDSAQVLFITLSNAYPFPVTYSAECSLADELQKFSVSIDLETQELQELKERLKVGVLPNLQCDPSLLRIVQQNSGFVSANEAIQSILLKAVSAKYSIDSKHETFLKKLSMPQTYRNLSLLFQLQLLYLRVSKSTSGYYERGSYNSFLTGDHELQLDTPSEYKAFLYLIDNWQYCLNPSDVLDIIVSRLCTSSESNGHEDEVAQLISTVLLADKDAVKSMKYSIGSLVNILAESHNPEHLLNCTDVLGAKNSGEKLHHVGRALVRLYSRIKGRAEETISVDVHLVRLKTNFMMILGRIIRLIQRMSRISYWYNSHGRYLLKIRVNVREWAPLVCAIGGDAIKRFLTVLSDYHDVNSLGKFPYSFCQDLGILWTEYSTSLPSGNPSILSVPVFEKIMTHLLPEKEENARSAIKKYRNNSKRVKEAMLLLASIYQPLQLEKEFNSFAFEMSAGCSGGIKHMIVKWFLNTHLSAIAIPTGMLNQLSLLDEQGTARLQVEKEKKDYHWEHEMAHDNLTWNIRMMSLVRESSALLRKKDNMPSSLWSGFERYYDEMEYDDMDYDDYNSF